MQAWILIKANTRYSAHYKRLIWQWCSVSALFGALIELLQKWVFVGRSYDYFDLAANVLGCIIALIIALKKYS